MRLTREGGEGAACIGDGTGTRNGGLVDIPPKSELPFFPPSCIAYQILYLPPFCSQRVCSHTYCEFVRVSKEAWLCHELLKLHSVLGKDVRVFYYLLYILLCSIKDLRRLMRTNAFSKRHRKYKGIVTVSMYMRVNDTYL